MIDLQSARAALVDVMDAIERMSDAHFAKDTKAWLGHAMRLRIALAVHVFVAPSHSAEDLKEQLERLRELADHGMRVPPFDATMFNIDENEEPTDITPMHLVYVGAYT